MVELGLDVPLFIAAAVAVGFGTLSGEVGTWRYMALPSVEEGSAILD